MWRENSNLRSTWQGFDGNPAAVRFPVSRTTLRGVNYPCQNGSGDSKPGKKLNTRRSHGQTNRYIRTLFQKSYGFLKQDGNVQPSLRLFFPFSSSRLFSPPSDPEPPCNEEKIHKSKPEGEWVLGDLANVHKAPHEADDANDEKGD